MSKIILYIAQSLDGKIATENGSVDWLSPFEGVDYGYQKFLDSVGIILMGNKTYRQVLCFGIEFPYKNKDVYVFTRDKSAKRDENATFISEKIVDFVSSLKKSVDSNIWLVGGAEIIKILIENKLVDELQLFTMPVILGKGIGLFDNLINTHNLHLSNLKSFPMGVVETWYKFVY